MQEQRIKEKKKLATRIREFWQFGFRNNVYFVILYMFLFYNSVNQSVNCQSLSINCLLCTCASFSSCLYKVSLYVRNLLLAVWNVSWTFVECFHFFVWWNKTPREISFLLPAIISGKLIWTVFLADVWLIGETRQAGKNRFPRRLIVAAVFFFFF